ncbi:MAG: STAS domain-containing protein [Solirubrobacterales bacterium]|nr:STAS domain-containing protein [Solirubrobacterales bacterium]
MKRQLTASAVGIGARSERGSSGVAGRTRAVFERSSRPSTPLGEPPAEPPPTLTSVGVWKHTLVLTGALDHHSAHELEAEIERLCEEGVTSITLDLRELTYIDSIGVAVIAFRCGLCKRRGYDFAVIPGSRLIQHAFERADVTNMLPFEEQDGAGQQMPALALALAHGGSAREDRDQA